MLVKLPYIVMTWGVDVVPPKKVIAPWLVTFKSPLSVTVRLVAVLLLICQVAVLDPVLEPTVTVPLTVRSLASTKVIADAVLLVNASLL